MNPIVSDNYVNEQVLNSKIDRFFNQINISKVLLKSNFYKESGFHCAVVLKELFSLKFFGKNLYQTLSVKSEELSFKKNTAYRFLNAGHFNWEKMLLTVMTNLISVLDQLTGNDRQSVLIFDDSLFSRNRSKKVEMMAKIFDHTSHKFCKGFRMLTLGWSDGNSFLPVSFNLLSSSKEENVLCPSKTLDKRTVGHKRRNRAMQSTTDALIEMLRAAKNIPAKFVLFDSWFTLPKTVVRVKKEKRGVIGMIRITSKIHYLFDGQWQNVKEIYDKIIPTSFCQTPLGYVRSASFLLLSCYPVSVCVFATDGMHCQPGLRFCTSFSPKIPGCWLL